MEAVEPTRRKRKMTRKTVLTINCMFCSSVIGLDSGTFTSFQKHLDNTHDVFYKKELVLALVFLSEDETRKLIGKLEERMESFFETGKLNFESILFAENADIEEAAGDIDFIQQQIEQDMDEEAGEALESQYFPAERIKSSKEEIENGRRDLQEMRVKIQKELDSSDEEEIDEQDVEDSTSQEDSGRDKVKMAIENILFNDDDDSDEQATVEEDCLDDSTSSTSLILYNSNQNGDEFDREEKDSEEENNANTEVESDGSHNSQLINLEEEIRDLEDTMEDDCPDSITPDDPDQDQVLEESLAEDGLTDNQRTEPTVNVDIPLVEEEEDKKSVDTKPKDSTETDVSEYDHINLVDKFIQENYCRLCYEVFSNRRNLTKHEETIHKDDQEALNLKFFNLSALKFKCQLCPQIPGFLTENILKIHKQRDHKIKGGSQALLLPKDVTCTVCSKVMRRHSLKNHMLIHNEKEKAFECKLCYKKFGVKKSLDAHTKKVHAEDEQQFFQRELTNSDLQFACTEESCELKFVNQNCVNIHKRIHYEKQGSPKIKKHKCKLCYKIFDNSDNLTKHESVHELSEREFLQRDITAEDLKYSCNVCDLKFVSSTLLKKHEECHESQKFAFLKDECFLATEKKYKCKLCYQKLSSFNSFVRHVTSIHVDEKELLNKIIYNSDLVYQCTNCDMRFISEISMNHHSLKKHGKSRADENATKMKQLKKKIKLEDRERYCKLCDIKYLKSRGFAAHKIRVHSTEMDAFELDIGAADRNCVCKCGRRFYSENSLEHHKQSKHAGGNISCKLCYSQFSRNSELKKHTSKNHKEDMHLLEGEIDESMLKHACVKCNTVFASENSLLYHQSREHTDMELTCKLCYAKYKMYFYLVRHQKKEHRAEAEYLNREIREEELKFDCEQCGYKFVTDNILQNHIKQHEAGQYEFLREESFDQANQRYSCKLCYSKFKAFSNLLNHCKGIHSNDLHLLSKTITDEDLKFPCLKCKAKFLKESLVEYHFSKRHEIQSDIQSNKCFLCNMNMKSSKAFMSHKYRIHGNEMDAFQKSFNEEDYIFKCDNCDVKYPTEASLKYHKMKNHEQYKEKQEKYCKLCYISYKKPVFLKIHKKKVHLSEMDAFSKNLIEEDLKYKCNKCAKNFYSLNTLEFHKQRDHSQSGSCKLCYAKFSQSNVVRHMKSIHSSDAHLFDKEIEESQLVHICHCKKKFASENILTYHKKTEHKEDIVPYCKLCQYNFKSKANLMSHIGKVHKSNEEKQALKNPNIDESSFSIWCQFCEKKFLTKDILKNHVFLRHAEERKKDLVCEYCDKTYKVDGKYDNRRANMKVHMKNVHGVDNYDPDEMHLNKTSTKNETVNNFMTLMNSL